jgi:hypothetical protein
VPLQERIRRDDPGHFLEDSSTQSLHLGGQAPTLIIGVAQLLPEHAILPAQVVDSELLLLVHPSGHCDQQKPERVDSSRHLNSHYPNLLNRFQFLNHTGRGNSRMTVLANY